MTPTATYIAEENCLQVEPTMKKPAMPVGAVHLSTAYAYERALAEYNAHLATLRKIPCDPSCKGLWADQQKVVEGKDYKLKFQFLFSKEPEKWITCDQPFYRNMDVPERPIAFPLVPVKSEDQDALWRDVYAEAEAAIDWQYQEMNDKKLIAILKQKYIITKR